jgi:DNA-binding IclR family transcriptional regulator
MDGTAGNVVKSAGRALAILEYFDEIMRPATAVEIRTRLGLPPSSASALLRSLVNLGYLHYNTSRRTYRPTLRVGLLGEWTQNKYLGSRSLHPLLDELSYATKRLVVLGVRCSLHAQYIHVVRPEEPARQVMPGTLAPLTRTAVGWVLISKLSDSQATRLITRVNAEEPAGKRISLSWLKTQVQEVRDTGYAFCYGHVTPGVGAIGMPLPTANGDPPVVLAVSGAGPDFVAQKEDIVVAMRSHVDRYLRCPPPPL